MLRGVRVWRCKICAGARKEINNSAIISAPHLFSKQIFLARLLMDTYS